MDINYLVHSNYFSTVIAAMALLMVPLILPIIRKISGINISKVASVGGGMAITAVFAFMVPDVISKIKAVSTHTDIKYLQQEHHLMYFVFISFLAAFCMMYALEKIALDRTKNEAKPDSFVFYFHMGILSLTIMALVSSFPILAASSVYALGIICLLATFEIFLEEIALLKHFNSLYSRFGRYIIMLAIILGLYLGIELFDQESTAFTLLTQAFVIGTILTAVIKNEFDIINQSNNYALFISSVAFKAIIIFCVITIQDANMVKNSDKQESTHLMVSSSH